MAFRIILSLVIAIPTVAVGVLLYFSPQVLTGDNAIDSSFALSLLGIALSYYGLIFSAYAALEVKKISDLYFFKIRSPDILRKLKEIAKAVSDFGGEPSEGLASQGFISVASVAFRSVKRTRNKDVTRVAEQAEAALRNLKASMKKACLPGQSAGEVPNYWEFHQKVAELVDEMNEQIKDTRAKP